ncbi:MAG: phosphomevalonate kinase [Candidatus Sericytochromatia bacterium]|nr:phosphomevalonate kinase [Candidatus Sericytochromatia bacterium]
MKSLKLRVPGKLFLLGEYAILEPGSQALLLSFQRYLQAEIAPAEQFWLQTDLLPGAVNGFGYEQGQIVWQTPEARPSEKLNFVGEALQWAFAYLESLERRPRPFRLQLHSDLHSSGAKLGLGSSAAVTVAVLAAVLAFHGEAFESHEARLKLFKLATLAHSGSQRGSQGGGSGADLAAVIFGSVTCYRRYDASWLKPGSVSLNKLLEVNWPLLGIEKLPWPADLGLKVGWTGLPAATLDFLEEISYLKEKDPEGWMRFLFSANAATAAARSALIEGQNAPLLQAVGQYRHLLQELQMEFLSPIETPALVALSDSAEALGLAAKSSGAGGGDCGLALGDPALVDSVSERWRSQGVEPLELALDFQGLCLEEG